MLIKTKRGFYYQIILFCTMLLMLLHGATTVLAEEPLSLNSKGDKVKLLQQKLIDLGYLNDYADGYFGPKTQKALTEWQQANGIEGTGIADETTMISLFPNGFQASSAATADSSSATLIPGYTALQSCYINISTDMSYKDVMDLAKAYKLYSYMKTTESKYSDKFVYICGKDIGSHSFGPDKFAPDNIASVEIIFGYTDDFKMTKLYYHFGTYSNGYSYSVEGRVKDDTSVLYSVVHGYLSVKPPMYYSSAKEAIDGALSLY